VWVILLIRPVRKFWSVSGCVLGMALWLWPVPAMAAEVTVEASVVARTFVIVDKHNHILQVVNNSARLSKLRVTRGSLSGPDVKNIRKIKSQIAKLDNLNQYGVIYQRPVSSPGASDRSLKKSYSDFSW
jgi:hypothetical protein